MAAYPESEKLAACSEDSHKTGEFLDWLVTVHDVALPCHIQRLLEQYYEIDMAKVEEERRLMLRHLRRASIMNAKVD